MWQSIAKKMTKRQLMTFRKGQVATGGVLGLVGITLAIAAGMMGYRNAGNTEPNAHAISQPLPVATARFQPAEQHPLYRWYTGVIQSRHNSQLGLRQPGRLVQILVEQGDAVREGQLLAQLDTQVRDAQIAEARARRDATQATLDELQFGPRKESIAAARARLDSALADLELARRDWERRQALKRSGAISTQEADEIRYRLQAAEGRWKAAGHELEELEAGTRPEQIRSQKGQLQQAEASLKRLLAERAETELRAPFDGRVTARLVDEGTILSAGQPVLELLDPRSLEVRLGLPSDLGQSLSRDTSYCFQVGQQRVSGELRSVVPQLNQGTRTLAAVFDLEIPPTQEPPAVGSLVRWEWQRQIPDQGYWIETNALQRGERGLWSVYVIQSEDDSAGRLTTPVAGYRQGILRRMDVELLELDTQRVLVRGPIDPGTRYVVAGGQKLTQGQRVSYRDELPVMP